MLKQVQHDKGKVQHEKDKVRYKLKKQIKIMKNILIILFVITFLSGCGEEKIEEIKVNKTGGAEKEKTESDFVSLVLSKESQDRIDLKTELLSEEQFTGYIKIPAVIITDQNNEAQAGPIVAGRVKKVYADVGSYVNAGQTLMLIEGLEIGVLKADFLKSKTTLEFTEQEYNRQKSLSEQNAGSQKNLISAKTEYEKALAEFNAMDKKIHSIGIRDEDIINEKSDLHSAGDLAIKSPISGVIVERNVVIGQYMESSFIAFKILNTKSLLVDGQIYESDFNKLGNSNSAEFKTQSVPNEVFMCDITYKGLLIDDKTRTIKIRAKVNNPRNKLLPQMFGELIIKLAENKRGLFVLSSAIYKDNDQSNVFVMENDSTFRKIQIKTGVELDEKVEVISGLKENDRVVINGVFELKSELLKESFGEGE
ncbi:MAG: efflux RND transporter periplasmic adaptor subunit [Ignavibacteriae bacterium]|nr:efflux RND transporter periplasmic adaptor subunit [Ignavibacteriota bacterium]